MNAIVPVASTVPVTSMTPPRITATPRTFELSCRSRSTNQEGGAMHSYDPVHDVTRTKGTQVPVNALGPLGAEGDSSGELPHAATMPHAAAITTHWRITIASIRPNAYS